MDDLRRLREYVRLAIQALGPEVIRMPQVKRLPKLSDSHGENGY